MNSAVQLTLPLQLLVQLRGSVTGPATSAQIEPATLREGYVPHPDVGVAYKVHNHTVSWKVARKQCNEQGADLALIDSYTKLEYVLRQKYLDNLTHVGILRMYDDEEWIGVATGLPVSPIPWARGEPTGATDCVMIKNPEYGLANYPCNTRANYVCEVPIPANYGAEADPPTDQPTQISAN